MSPERKNQVRHKYAPCLRNTTKELMTERNLAQKKAAQSGETDIWKIVKK